MFYDHERMNDGRDDDGADVSRFWELCRIDEPKVKILKPGDDR